jgi:hypothetical protein
MNHSVAVSVAFKTEGSGKQTKGPGCKDLVIPHSGEEGEDGETSETSGGSVTRGVQAFE